MKEDEVDVDPDKDKEDEIGQEVSDDRYHGNSIPMVGHSRDKYQPIKTTGDDEVVSMMANKEIKGLDENNMDNEVQITTNGNYHLLQSEDDAVHGEEKINITENPQPDTEVISVSSA